MPAPRQARTATPDRDPGQDSALPAAKAPSRPTPVRTSHGDLTSLKPQVTVDAAAAAPGPAQDLPSVACPSSQCVATGDYVDGSRQQKLLARQGGRNNERQRLCCSQGVVRGGVEPPTFRFSGVAYAQLTPDHASAARCRRSL